MWFSFTNFAENEPRLTYRNRELNNNPHNPYHDDPYKESLVRKEYEKMTKRELDKLSESASETILNQAIVQDERIYDHILEQKTIDVRVLERFIFNPDAPINSRVKAVKKLGKTSEQFLQSPRIHPEVKEAIVRLGMMEPHFANNALGDKSLPKNVRDLIVRYYEKDLHTVVLESYLLEGISEDNVVYDLILKRKNINAECLKAFIVDQRVSEIFRSFAVKHINTPLIFLLEIFPKKETDFLIRIATVERKDVPPNFLDAAVRNTSIHLFVREEAARNPRLPISTQKDIEDDKIKDFDKDFFKD